MKKTMMLSVIAAAILSTNGVAAQVKGFDRIGGFMSMHEIKDHADENMNNQQSRASSSATTQYNATSSAQRGNDTATAQSQVQGNYTGSMEHSSSSSADQRPKAQGYFDEGMQQAQDHFAQASSSSSSADQRPKAQGYFDEGMQQAQDHFGQASSSSSSADQRPKAQGYFDEGMQQAQDHYAQASSSSSSADQRPKAQGYFDEGMQQAQDHFGQAYSQSQQHFDESSASSNGQEHRSEGMQHNGHKTFIDYLTQNDLSIQVPQNIKEVMQEARTAAVFYKKPQFFEDLNITDPSNMTPEDIQKIKERVEKAKEARAKEIEERILGQKNRKVLSLAGEFVKIGQGQFDWSFVTKSGRVFKLDGVDQSGHFSYKALSGVSATIKPDGTVIFHANDALTIELPSQAKGLPFAQYGDASENGFDWVIALPNGKLYKLEGYDKESKSFVYAPVDAQAKQEGDEVVVLPGTES